MSVEDVHGLGDERSAQCALPLALVHVVPGIQQRVCRMFASFHFVVGVLLPIEGVELRVDQLVDVFRRSFCGM